MNSWTVNGINQLNQQWFWFSIDGGPQMDLSQITSTPTITSTGTNQFTATYQNALYKATIAYTLSGFTSPSSKSSLTELINFKNMSGGDIDLSFFMYSDFTLGGSGFANDQNILLGTSGNVSTAIQTVTGSGASNNVAINFDPASEMEVSAYPQLYNEVTTSNGYILNGVLAGGPGHETWAMQWDTHLTNGASMSQISVVDALQAPEPGFGVFAIVGVLVGVLSRKRRKTVQRCLTHAETSVLLHSAFHTYSEET